MIKYFKLFGMHFKLAVMSAAIYRINFMLMVIQNILNAMLGIIAMELIYGQVDSIAGWNKHEMIILVCTSQIVGYIFWSVISPNQDRFLNGIANGGFDRTILKPLNLMFQINTGSIDTSCLFSISALAVILFVQMSHLESQAGIIQILLYIVFVINGVMVMTAFRMLVDSLAFIFIRVGGLDNICGMVESASTRPKEIFSNKYVRSIFVFILPAIPMINAPAAVLLQKCTVFEMLCYLGTGIMFSVLAVITLRLGMKKYNSASS
ncbi:MAG: ABC-2 family transporter protein [Oscillospiraceae bacterium]|nr:ABC-2 family transporter protein [Oscillospiraceae bacterium]